MSPPPNEATLKEIKIATRHFQNWLFWFSYDYERFYYLDCASMKHPPFNFPHFDGLNQSAPTSRLQKGRSFEKSTRAMATSHHSSFKRVLILVHFKRTPNQRLQNHFALTRRQREERGRAPNPRRRSILRKGRPRQASIFYTASLPTLTRLRQDFLQPHLPKGPDPKRQKTKQNKKKREILC